MRRPTLTLAALLALAPALRADDPAWLQVDLPTQLRMSNVGSSVDRNGLCVTTSVTMSARFQGEARLYGLRAYAEKLPGGSTPQRLTADLKRFAPDVPVLQVTGADLAFIGLCLDNGYMVSTTYGGGHMLSVVGLSGTQAAVLDNNSPDTVQVMRRSEFYARARMGGGIWIVVVLSKGPPAPIPVNALPLPAGRAPLSSGCNYRQPPAAGARYWVGDRTIDRATAESLVKKGGLPRLTCVGDKAACDRFEADAAKSLTGYGDRLVIQSYAADHPLAAGVGLVPGVYLQAPPGKDGRGKVLWRLRSYKDAAQLAAALRITERLRPEALRRPDPGYDPAKDRDPEQAPPPAQPDAEPDTEPPTPASTDPMSTAVVGALGGAVPMILGLLVMFLTRRGASPAPPVALPAAPPPTVLPVAQSAAHPLLSVLFAGHPVAQGIAALVVDEVKAFATARMTSAAKDLAAGLLGGLSPAPAPAAPAPAPATAHP